MRVLIFGDSIAQGFWDTEGGWAARLRRHYNELALKDLQHSNEPEIFNLGISGDTTRSLLTRIGAETDARKWYDNTPTVVIAIGTNDDLFESSRQWVPPEEFAANLEKIVAILKPLAAAVMFVGNPACDETKTTPVSWGDFHYTNRELQRSEQTMQKVANEHGLPFVPVFDGFKARLDAGEDLLTDGLHPNNEGHELIARLVLPELDTLLKN